MWNEQSIVMAGIGGGALVLGSAGALRLVRERSVALTKNGQLANTFERKAQKLQVMLNPKKFEGDIEEEEILALNADLDRIQALYALSSTTLQRVFFPHNRQPILETCVNEITELTNQASRVVLIRPRLPRGRPARQATPDPLVRVSGSRGRSSSVLYENFRALFRDRLKNRSSHAPRPTQRTDTRQCRSSPEVRAVEATEVRTCRSSPGERRKGALFDAMFKNQA